MDYTEAILWLREARFSTLYPTEYQRQAKEAADAIEEEVFRLEGVVLDITKECLYYKDRVHDAEILNSRHEFPTQPGANP